MQAELTAINSIEIDADVSKVWETLTNPVHIKKYLFGTETSSNWLPGSSITFKGEWEGKSYEDKGTILEIESNKLLKYSYWSSMSGKDDLPENYRNVTYKLFDANGKTKLRIEQDGIISEQELEHSDKNWAVVLEGIKRVAER